MSGFVCLMLSYRCCLPRSTIPSDILLDTTRNAIKILGPSQLLRGHADGKGKGCFWLAGFRGFMDARI